ncbi:MAG: EipB family protein [Holosporaceae bacterium]
MRFLSWLLCLLCLGWALPSVAADDEEIPTDVQKPFESLSLDQIALLLSPKKAFKLYPYQAEYSLHKVSEGGKDNDQDIEDIDGSMKVKLSLKDHCWSYREEGNCFHITPKGKLDQLEWVYDTKESVIGQHFSFDYYIKKNGRNVVHNKGSVVFDPLSKTGTIYWEQPYKSMVSVYNKLVFPQGFTSSVLKLIKKTPQLHSFYVFDGKTRGLLPLRSCFLDRPQKMPWSLKTSIAMPAHHLVAWPVFQAFYKESSFCERLTPTDEKFGLLAQGGVFLQKIIQLDNLKVLCALRGFSPLAAA